MLSFEMQFKASARTSRVVVGHGARRAFFENAPEVARADGVFLVHDSALADRADELRALLPSLTTIAHPGGENEKTLGNVERLAADLAEAGANRKSLLIVLGGGSLSDLGAFVAAVYMRGIECVLMPTTVLAMVDASIGGKNGVDLIGLKNFVGVIRQPTATIIDPELLDSLPDRAFREGFVEAVKTAAMLDSAAFASIEADLDRILRRDRAAVLEAITASARLKATLVMEDEREADRRMLLNYGHTVGHAMESLSGFEIAHGEAVAIGMNVESLMAASENHARIAAITSRLIPGLRPPSPSVAAALWNLMMRDKKAQRGRVRIAVPERIGEGKVIEVTEADLERALLP